MSSIYFHTKDFDGVRVSGSERAYMGCFLNDLCMGILEGGLNLSHGWGDINALIDMLPEGRAERVKDWVGVRLALTGAGVDLSVNGEKYPSFDTVLNTASRVGGDAVKLMCRIHGQCEIHCWVSSDDTEWISSIISEGLTSGLFRQGQGWDDVLTLLSKTKSHVAMSYSVTDGFPFWDDDNDEYFGWDESMKILKESTGLLQIKPENWRGYYFGNGGTFMDVIKFALSKGGN